MPNPQNLISLGDRSEEDRKRIASMGGKASGEARAKTATFKKELEILLEQTNSKGFTYKKLSLLGLIDGACKGKAENMKLMLQLTGELDPEEQTGTPQVNINIVDNSELEKVLYEDENE